MDRMKRIRIPKTICPACLYAQDSVSEVTKRKLSVQPKPGDITICLNCGALLEFGKGLKLSSLPLATILNLPQDVAKKLCGAVAIIKARGPLPSQKNQNN